MAEPRPCVHFVGFRGDEYLSALKVWGEPDFYHRAWDSRAAREIAEHDTVVFARGEHTQPYAERGYSDTRECEQLEQLSVEVGRRLAEQAALGRSSG